MPVVLQCPVDGCEGWLEIEAESPVGPVYVCNRCGYGTLARRLTGIAQMSAQPAQAPKSSPEPKGQKTAQETKYHSRKTECHQGHLHDSRKESRRCDELHLMQKAGEIMGLEVQPVFHFDVNGHTVGRYTPDFSYCRPVDTGTGFPIQRHTKIVEDVKSTATKTEAYRLRKKLMLACFGIEVKET